MGQKMNYIGDSKRKQLPVLSSPAKGTRLRIALPAHPRALPNLREIGL